MFVVREAEAATIRAASSAAASYRRR